MVRRRSISAASDAAPTTRAPLKGDLHGSARCEGADDEDEKDEAECCFASMTVPVAFPAISLNVTDRLPFPLRRCGMYSSSTAWKFVPPKPKALKPARRTASGGMSHGL